MSILKKKVDTYILGIESSCDDTSAAVWKDGKILSNCVANQEIHALYGGVVPEVEHISKTYFQLSNKLSNKQVFQKKIFPLLHSPKALA